MRTILAENRFKARQRMKLIFLSCVNSLFQLILQLIWWKFTFTRLNRCCSETMLKLRDVKPLIVVIMTNVQLKLWLKKTKDTNSKNALIHPCLFICNSVTNRVWQWCGQTLCQDPEKQLNRGAAVCHSQWRLGDLSTPINLSYWRLIVEDFGFEIPQAALQVGAGFWLQGLGELDVWSGDGVFPFDGVLDGLWGEVINNGVKAAVGHGDAKSYWVNTPHHWFHKATFQSFGPDQRVEDQVDIVRHKTEAEYWQVHNDHAQDFGFVQLPATAYGLRST